MLVKRLTIFFCVLIFVLFSSLLFAEESVQATTKEDNSGIEWAPVGLVFAPYKVKGLFLGVSPFGNYAQSITGVQLGLGTSVRDEMKGLNIALGSSCGTMTGLQFSIGTNSADVLRGVQIGGANARDYFTFSGVDVKGVQVGILLNIAKEARGVQIGLVNIARRMKGFQIGAVNFCKSMSGVQIGILNIIQEGALPFFPVANMSFSF